LRKILFFIDHLAPHGAAKQLSLMVPALAAAGFATHVCCLGSADSFAGFAAHALGWKRPLDLPALVAAYRQIRDVQPELIHACGPASVALLGVPGMRAGRPLVCESAPDGLGDNALAGFMQERGFQQAARIVVPDEASVPLYKRLGVADERIVVVPPAVAPATDPPRPADVVGLRYLLCVGPFATHKGFRNAVWAFDILRYVVTGVHLLFVGDGPDRDRLETFAREAHLAELLRFLGRRDDALALVAHAEAVWAPSVGRGGVNVALEAQAAGRAVVAADVPALAAVVENGKTGMLYPPGVQSELARATRRLLENDELRARLGAAGRAQVAERFSVAERVRRLTAVYEAVTV
jgi:glycosyltransferase involved in cell wall biosynthesis